MHKQTNAEQALGQFEIVQQQVMTFALSEQIPSPLLNNPSPGKKHSKNHQKHRLELLHTSDPLSSFNIREANKNMRRLESGQGKIIPIGGATFKSNFECGNISSVKITAPNTYQIQLERQTNSIRTSAWFYFSVEGLKGQNNFVIQGFKKSSSLYNEGMKICYREVKQTTAWRRGANHITYTNTIAEDGDDENQNYQLRFTHVFKYNELSCIQFAYCFPYGLRKLYNLIANFPKQMHCSSLGKSYLGQNIPLLTIGNVNSENVIVLSARVHPGQTVSSFIMQGFIRQLLGDNDYGQLLRTHFLFKIVPMLNPDGVIKGNYRFSGYGCDLNRKWRNCKPNQQPEVYLMREFLRTLKEEKKVRMYIDMHGHSRKKNVFFYGCCEKGDTVNVKPRAFPYLMSKIYEAFKYQNCCFSVQRDKEGTARITAWRQLKIDYVYTLQASFCGSEHSSNYLEADYDKIGRKLCEGMAVLFYSEVQSAKSSIPFKSLQRLNSVKTKAFEQLNQNPQLLKVGQNDDSGSESEPQLGQISQKDRNPQSGIPKNYAYSKEALLKMQKKVKKQTFSSNFFSQQPVREINTCKIKSQMTFGDQIITKTNNSNKDRQKQSTKSIRIEDVVPTSDKVEIKITNSVNTFEMEALRASSLYQKKVRVHSLTRNNHRSSQSSQPIVPLITETTRHQKQQQRIRINLMHGKEGAQYRRVRKMALQNTRKDYMDLDQSIYTIKELQCNQMQMGRTRIVSHRIYPSSQKNRKMSVEASMRKPNTIQPQFKRLSINGDEFKVRCQGRQIYL